MESNREKTLFSVFVYSILFLSACIGGGLHGFSRIEIFARAGYLVVLGAVFLMIVYWNEEFIWKQINNKKLYLAALGLSILLTGVSASYSVGSYWLLLLMAAICTAGIHTMALSYSFLMVSYVIQVLWSGGDIGTFSYYLILGAALILVFSMIKHRKEIPYATVILLALSTALQILMYQFDLQKMWQLRYDYLLELFSLFFLILFGTALKIWQEAGSQKKTASEELLVYLEDGFELLDRLKKHEELYHHCYEISRISSLAAREIGCDSTLAAAGGLYHEIGRILEDTTDYIETSMKLSKEYHFPDRLTAIIRQHNTGSEVPKSPEAAIVMLSDCIVSTSEYLRRSGKRSAISDDKLVHSIFTNRLEKGNLSEARLTEEQLEQLKAFYISAERVGY